MLRDAYDMDVTTTSPATIDAINVYTADWIGYGTRLRTIFEAADNDPESALANASAAAVHMALEAAGGFQPARRYIKRARMVVRDANEREQLFVAAVVAWWRGDTPTALSTLRQLTRKYPADIAAAKWGQYHAFNLGRPEAVLAFAEDIAPAHPRSAHAWGLRAFGLEQCSRLDEAEEAARRALSLKRAEPWAQHAIAHVMDAQGRLDEGVAFLQDYAHTWKDRSIFVREHNYWHLALMHLERDEPAEALKVYDNHLWGEWPEFAQEQLGAISALWRLELRGADVGDRWSPIVEKVLARWHEHILSFHDMHFIYALARGGRTPEARAFITSLARRGERDASGVWESVALPLAVGLVTYAEGKFEQAMNFIARALPRLQLIGGSHVQRDVFVQTWIDAALKAGHHSAAAEVLTQRHRERPQVAATRRLLDQAKRGPRRIAAESAGSLQVSAAM
jgi:tetratricopeptide (TPR) repeat protein